MKVIDKGHKYVLDDNKTPTQTTTITFYKDEEINGYGYNSTTNQEVLRAVIDRVKFLDEQEPHLANKNIIRYLRWAIVLHEQRHLERLVDRNEAIELIPVKKSGHFV